MNYTRRKAELGPAYLRLDPELLPAVNKFSKQFQEQTPNAFVFLTDIMDRDPTACTAISMPDMPFWNNKKKTPEEEAHIKDRANTLQAGINLEFDEKLDVTERIIKRALDTEANWAVSYSGGRDSTVLSHIMVEHMGITDIPHVFSNTRMEYPESLVQVRKWYDLLRAKGVECHTCFPDKRPNTLWKEIGVPLWSKEIAYKYRKFRMSESDVVPKAVPKYLHADFKKAKELDLKITDKCCDELKKKPMAKWDKEHGITGHFIGIRCDESRSRRLLWIMKGALYQDKSHRNMWKANPLAFWTEKDLNYWMDIHGITIERPDTPTGGSGCVTCMFGCQSRAQEGTLNNLQDLKTRNPKMYKAALDDWGYREVLDKLDIPYE